MVERYDYTAYGEVTVRDADYSVDADGISDIGNEYLYTGRRLDPETGLQLNRNRYYHAPLGRWVNRDPIGYWGGINLYEYVRGMPVGFFDPSGLQTCPGCLQEYRKRLHKCGKDFAGCGGVTFGLGTIVCVGGGIVIGAFTFGIGGVIFGGVCETATTGTALYQYTVCQETERICKDNAKLIYNACCKEDCDKPIK